MKTLTEAIIRQHAGVQSFADGKEYYDEGAVLELTKSGDVLEAEVEGRNAASYEVAVTFNPDGGIDAHCDCRRQGTDWCKHIVAALLCYLNESDRVETLPSLETLLSPLDRDTLQTLLLNLARGKADLTAEIAMEITRIQTQPAPRSGSQTGGTSPSSPRPAPIDPSVIRRQVRAALKGVGSSGDSEYWDDDDSDRVAELEAGIFPLVEIADAFTEADDGHGALPILEAITDELVGDWDRVEGIISEASELFGDLGRAWAEALLTTELTRKERDAWIVRLNKWQYAGQYSGAKASSKNYRRDSRTSAHAAVCPNRDTCCLTGPKGGLEVAVEAARQGWDYPPLVRVLQGEITDKGAWEDKPADCADELAVARLNVLERQGRLQEAAYLAEAESQSDRYMALLVQLGRVKEAVDYGMEVLTTAESALALTKVLYEHGETALAFRIAKHGMKLQGPCYPLAIWTRDVALETRDTDRAIQAALTAIKESPQMNDYTHLQRFSGERWPQLRDEILASLRKSHYFDASSKVDIFVHEGLMEDALHAVRDSWNYTLVARVVEAATPTLPLQVIPICKGQAAAIMDAGKADRYHHAARWVERARDAYRAAGQEMEWRAYKDSLLAAYHRKYKLIPMLRDL